MGFTTERVNAHNYCTYTREFAVTDRPQDALIALETVLIVTRI